MRKRLYGFLLVLCSAFLLTACGGSELKVRLEALGKNEALLPNVTPCATVEEVQAAKIPLQTPPFDSQNNEEAGLESVTYLVQDKKFTFRLAGKKCTSGFFQFINGKFSNLTVNLEDASSCNAAIEALTKLYGEPTVEEPIDGIFMHLWEFQSEYPVRAAVINRTAEGEISSGTFQVSYIWFDTEE